MNAQAVDRGADALMCALEDAYGDAITTPGGVSWLHVHYVPVRRLVSRLVRRLLGTSPGLTAGGDDSKFVVANDSASLGYVAYDVTEAGLAYLLGRHRCEPPSDPDPQGWEGEPSLPRSAAAPVCAVSWSSRHAATLQPVLAELARRGLPSAVVDFATEPDQHFSDPRQADITVARVPEEILSRYGGLPVRRLSASRGDRAVAVGQHEIPIDRLATLVTQALGISAGCTQPSWSAALRAERWLDQAFARLLPSVLLCSNDTSPLGVLAVHVAGRAGTDTVYVQHGAWVEGQVAWRAQFCRHIAVMGARDVQTARTWTRRPDARTYIVGQPRFDMLVQASSAHQRAYLEGILTGQTGGVPAKIAVWACQPFNEARLRTQFNVIQDGLRNTAQRWGLVIAPHPVQSPAALVALLDAAEGARIALATPEVGARGCLAGADAVISASSTCGIEALLLDVPVLELTLHATRTLKLAEHGAAQTCASGEEVTVALARVDRTPEAVRVPLAAKDSICRWDSRSAATVADIVTDCLTENSAPPRRHNGLEQP